MNDSELNRYALGQVMQFPRNGECSDQTFEGVVDVELVDAADGEVEFAFNVGNPKRRTSLRMKLRDLRRLLKGVKP